MKLTVDKIDKFLNAVDGDFPVPLSEKQDLHQLAAKLAEKGTVCFAQENGEICSMVLGYTENVIGNMGYISIVATIPLAKGKGYASRLVREFVEKAREKGLSAVHLYAVKDNIPAVRMYKKLGFTEYKFENEPRPDDLHLIYYI